MGDQLNVLLYFRFRYEVRLQDSCFFFLACGLFMLFCCLLDVEVSFSSSDVALSLNTHKICFQGLRVSPLK